MNTAIVLNVNSGVYWRQLFTNPKAAQEQHSLSRELLALSRWFMSRKCQNAVYWRISTRYKKEAHRQKPMRFSPF